MVLWNITVTDISTSKGVANANVYLFEGGGGVEPPENASFSTTTDVNGVATFDVPEVFYRVGVFASGYESTYEPHNPPEEWKNVWTCWGAGGAGHEYDFPVKPSAEPGAKSPLLIALPLAVGAVMVFMAK